MNKTFTKGGLDLRQVHVAQGVYGKYKSKQEIRQSQVEYEIVVECTQAPVMARASLSTVYVYIDYIYLQTKN